MKFDKGGNPVYILRNRRATTARTLMIRPISLFGLALLSIGLTSCKTDKESADRANTIVIGVDGDVDSFNPLFAEEATAGEVNDLLFPSLVGSEFDTSNGVLLYTPLLARSWEFSDDGKDVTFHFRWPATWSDGKPVTSRDVQLSYELYGDPEIASVRQGSVQELRLTDGKLDISKSIETPNDSTVIFHFGRSYPGQLFDAGLPILPSHMLDSIPRKQLRASPVNKTPVGSGPFRMAKWTPLQETVLLPNEQSVLPYPAKSARLSMRVLPDYRTRIAQLQSGEVDLVAGLRVEDAALLERSSPSIRIVTTTGRDYDFLGWNNIDPTSYTESGGKTIKPHRFFGNSRVRKALTLGINREEIVNAYLGKHGRVALGPVSPMFKWAYNDTLKHLPYDKALALSLLEKEGWKDTDGDGVLDRNGEPFAFSLKVPSGNQLRQVIATVIQKQLKDIKIAVTIDQVERGTFWDELLARKYDAWFAGFSVPLQLQLDDMWGSDLEKYPFNLTGFRNKRIDEILASVKSFSRETDGAALWKEFQSILHEEQPCTFLFWQNSIVGVNVRVQGTNIGVLGTTYKAWDWSTKDSETKPQ